MRVTHLPSVYTALCRASEDRCGHTKVIFPSRKEEILSGVTAQPYPRTAAVLLGDIRCWAKARVTVSIRPTRRHLISTSKYNWIKRDNGGWEGETKY